MKRLCSGATIFAMSIRFAESQPNTVETNTAESICSLDHSSTESLYASYLSKIGGALILLGRDDDDHVEAPSDPSLQENVPRATIKNISIERSSMDKYPKVSIKGVIRGETSNDAIDSVILIKSRLDKLNPEQPLKKILA